MSTMTPAEAMAYQLDRLGITLGTRPGRHAGGEWDAWRRLPRRTQRRLIGLGWAGPRGMAPDRFADALGADSPCEAVAELVRAARTAGNWRSQRQAASRRQLARRLGFTSYHQHREAQARQEGHRSYRAKRAAMGWVG